MVENIVIVNDYLFVNGGASKVAIDEAIMLKKKGYNVIFFSAVGPIDKRLNDYNVKVINLEQDDILNNPNRIEAIIQGLWNKDSKNKFIELIKELDSKNTIIHIHTLSKAISSSIVRVAIKNKFNVVYHMHDYGVACPNLGFYNYKQKKICELKALGPKCMCTNCDSRKFIHKVWRTIRQYIQNNMGLVQKDVKHFIAVSNFSANILADYLPKDAKIHTLFNPIDIQKEEIEKEVGEYFIFVGRLTREKDPLTPAIAAKLIDAPIKFIGDGELKEEVKKVNSNAELLGWLTHNQVHQYLRKAKALILSSRWYETQGMVVSEAVASGVPVIVSNTSAATDFINENKNGVTFETGNPHDLAKKMNLFLNSEKVNILKENAYQSYWNAPLSSDRHLNGLIKIYEGVLQEGVKK